MKNKLITGVACYYDFYRSCIVEYLIDKSEQNIEAVRSEVGGVTSFSSKTVGDVILQVSKVQEITSYIVDEIANVLVALNKDEYLIQSHPHLASFLSKSIQIELSEQNLQADHDLLLAMKKKSNFRMVDYAEKAIVNKPLMLLAIHVKPWFFTSVKKTKPSFCVATVPSWRSQQSEYPTAPQRVSELEEMLASLKYSKGSTEILESGQTKTIWNHPHFQTYTTVYESDGISAVALY